MAISLTSSEYEATNANLVKSAFRNVSLSAAVFDDVNLPVRPPRRQSRHAAMTAG